MSKKRTILMGTAILTITGLLTRVIGFFFRIFLSHSFGEEQMGIYQLVFPIYALCYSLTCAGIEIALSRFVARKVALQRKSEAIQLLYIGLILSTGLSLLVMLGVRSYAYPVAIYLLGDIRCAPLVEAIVYSLPFASVHSCICGYYLGLKQTKIPAISQLLEQIMRVGTVFVLYQIAIANEGVSSVILAVYGILAGEFVSSLFCLRYFLANDNPKMHSIFSRKSLRLTRQLLQLALPLTSNRILLNILQSIESISIPLRLQQYGYSTSEALSNYGVLTGMALPCILFPSAITNSVSTMLLPTVAEIQASKDHEQLKRMIQKVVLYCTCLGLACCLFFLIGGSFFGTFLFHSQLASKYICTLAWICPFLYLNTTLISIINGLGKATTSFFINSFGLLIRICGVLFFIPQIGMNGYLWGLLVSQCLTSCFCFWYLKLHFKQMYK